MRYSSFSNYNQELHSSEKFPSTYIALSVYVYIYASAFTVTKFDAEIYFNKHLFGPQKNDNSYFMQFLVYPQLLL